VTQRNGHIPQPIMATLVSAEPLPHFFCSESAREKTCADKAIASYDIHQPATASRKITDGQIDKASGTVADRNPEIVCPICWKSWKHPYLLKRHLLKTKKRCNPSVVLKDEDGKFSCPLCPERAPFYSNDCLQNHLFKMHKPEAIARTGIPVATLALRPGREAYLDAANARAAKSHQREA
jgi:hypothetical protein